MLFSQESRGCVTGTGAPPVDPLPLLAGVNRRDEAWQTLQRHPWCLAQRGQFVIRFRGEQRHI